MQPSHKRLSLELAGTVVCHKSVFYSKYYLYQISNIIFMYNVCCRYWQDFLVSLFFVSVFQSHVNILLLLRWGGFFSENRLVLRHFWLLRINNFLGFHLHEYIDFHLTLNFATESIPLTRSSAKQSNGNTNSKVGTTSQANCQKYHMHVCSILISLKVMVF